MRCLLDPPKNGSVLHRDPGIAVRVDRDAHRFARQAEMNVFPFYTLADDTTDWANEPYRAIRYDGDILGRDVVHLVPCRRRRGCLRWESLKTKDNAITSCRPDLIEFINGQCVGCNTDRAVVFPTVFKKKNIAIVFFSNPYPTMLVNRNITSQYVVDLNPACVGLLINGTVLCNNPAEALLVYGDTCRASYVVAFLPASRTLSEYPAIRGNDLHSILRATDSDISRQDTELISSFQSVASQLERLQIEIRGNASNERRAAIDGAVPYSAGRRAIDEI